MCSKDLQTSMEKSLGDKGDDRRLGDLEGTYIRGLGWDDMDQATSPANIRDIESRTGEGRKGVTRIRENIISCILPWALVSYWTFDDLWLSHIISNVQNAYSPRAHIKGKSKPLPLFHFWSHNSSWGTINLKPRIILGWSVLKSKTTPLKFCLFVC